MTNLNVVYIETCIALVTDNLQTAESILRIEQGQTSYGRQTFLYYRAIVGNYSSTGAPSNLRPLVIEINVDTPHGPQFVGPEKFTPLPLKLEWPENVRGKNADRRAGINGRES